MFFDILAEELARRDLEELPIDEQNPTELDRRIDDYIDEFAEHGIDNVLVDTD